MKNLIHTSTNKLLKQQFIFLFSILFFLVSCSAQVQSISPTDPVNQLKNDPIGQPKLIKSDNSNQSSSVFCSLQDKAGNLWFGTTGNGIYKFDGELFFNYTVAEGLNSNTVYSILEDTIGNIWIGTTDGVCFYNGKVFTPVPIPANYYPTNGSNYYTDLSTQNTVWSMLQDKNGKIWFGTGNGVYCYEGNTVSPFLQNDNVVNKENLHLKMIGCMVEDKNGTIWFASGMPPGMEGVCSFDGKSISSFKPNGDSWIRYIVEDKNGNLWFSGRNNGNFIYDGNMFTNFTQKTGIGNPILVDHLGNIWFNGEEKQSTIESDGGIWRYDGKTFKNFNTNDGLSKYYAFTMLEDKNGNIWIGTRNTGLFKYDGKSFTSYTD